MADPSRVLLFVISKGFHLIPFVGLKQVSLLDLSQVRLRLLLALLISIVLFTVSAYTPKTDPAKLEKTTINYRNKIEKFSGLTDWRLQLAVLTIITIGIYIWLS